MYYGRGALYAVLMIGMSCLFPIRSAFADCWGSSDGLYETPAYSTAQDALDDASRHFSPTLLGHKGCLFNNDFEPVVDFISIDSLVQRTSDGIPIVYERLFIPIGAHAETCNFCDGVVCASPRTFTAYNGSYISGLSQCQVAYVVELSQIDAPSESSVIIKSV